MENESVDFTENDDPLNVYDIEFPSYKQNWFQAKSPLQDQYFVYKKEELIKFYTGFQDYATLFAFYKTMLESDASVMCQWDG